MSLKLKYNKKCFFSLHQNCPNPYLQVKLESPPLTPPRDSADVSNFILTNGTDNCSTTVVPTGISIGPKKTLKPKGMPIAPKPATGHVQKPSTNGEIGRGNLSLATKFPEQPNSRSKRFAIRQGTSLVMTQKMNDHKKNYQVTHWRAFDIVKHC